jgi:hypothetical protein
VLYANPAFLETAGLGAEDAAELSLRNVLVPLGRRTVFWRGLQVRTGALAQSLLPCPPHEPSKHAASAIAASPRRGAAASRAWRAR